MLGFESNFGKINISIGIRSMLDKTLFLVRVDYEQILH